MNYVGKFFSNFKGFYNDINSATLTGAIDIIVVRLENGSFVTSPWHVRFGKMGVIRAREKQVDIEINGEPIKLCMKLGEAGEAFFVQETDCEMQIPSCSESKSTTRDSYHNHVDSDADGGRDDDDAVKTSFYHHHPHADVENELTDEVIDGHCDTVITIDGDKITVTEVPKMAAETESVTMDNNHYFSTIVGSRLSVGCKMNKTTKFTQTDMSGNDVEAKQSKSRNASGENSSPSSFSGTLMTPLAFGTETVAGLAIPSTFQHLGVAYCVEKASPAPEETDASAEADRGEISGQYSLLDEAEFSTPSADVAPSSPFPPAARPTPKQLEEIFEIDLSDDEATEKQKQSSVNGAKNLTIEVLGDDLDQDWRRSSYASNSHPFSDTDITPATSPIGSRPPSPKSDTEYERKKYDATSQTQLSGDELMVLDDIKWEWGEFPQLSPLPAKKPTALEPTAKEEKPSGGLFQFMRKTKKLRHQPQEEGIYLDDLDLASMDPEVAALYLYEAKSGHMATVQSKDEDSESGQGLSLPQSPIGFGQENLTTAIQETSEKAGLQDNTILSDVAMSLCGGLQDVERGVASEQFNKYLVTYDSFCDNPNLLTDPNLVVRMDGRFYSWSVAGTMIMSKLVFNQSLSQNAVDSLVKLHMPKKERGRRLWWWSRGKQVIASATATVPTSDTSVMIKNSSSKDLTSELEVKVKSKARLERGREGSTSGEESDSAVAPPLGSSRSRTRDKYVKSLKLTSEQLETLNLNDGANEIVFSVTTQYQGTSRCTCFLYLWNWDDRIIVSDIDGTITRSDVWGQVLPMIGKDWSQAGIANLYQMINRNGYKFLYLSARAIGQSRITRDYLHSVRQGDLCLPDGPLLLSPSSLLSAFYKEVIERKPEEFKIGCLRDISILFPPSRTPFYAGFGNKINDTFAYKAVGIPISRIFTVNPKGELSIGMCFRSSYTKLSDIVDHFFPPLLHCNCHHEVIEAGKFPGATEYSDFTYWREPLPDIQDELTCVVSTKIDKNTNKKDSGREKLRQSKKVKKK